MCFPCVLWGFGVVDMTVSVGNSDMCQSNGASYMDRCCWRVVLSNVVLCREFELACSPGGYRQVHMPFRVPVE